MQGGWEILARVQGQELVGLKYEPLFPYFAHLANAFRVLSDGYVTDESGTGIVHQVTGACWSCWLWFLSETGQLHSLKVELLFAMQAPAFGEDDHRVCLAHGIIEKGDTSVPCPVDLSGLFTKEVPDFEGQ